MYHGIFMLFIILFMIHRGRRKAERSRWSKFKLKKKQSFTLY